MSNFDQAFGQDSSTQGISFDEKSALKQPTATTRSIRTNSSSSTSPSLNTARKARFAEATTINSPVSGPTNNTKMASAIAKPSDVGFGYIADNTVEHQVAVGPNVNGPASPPLKSAMKAPGTARTFTNPLSPTFREEQVLEKQETLTDREQAKDLKVKTRVRMAKMVLRGVNFSCSLIVLSMLSTTFNIFNATKSLPPRNNLPAWSSSSSAWPQITVLVVSVISLAFATIIMCGYWRGGHKRAQKTAVYYNLFAVGYFTFSVVMWLLGAAVLHASKATGNGQDIWGWSCKENRRSQLFQDDVHYALICRLQDWSLVCCVIEVVVELITISIYGIMFYRYYSKSRLRKSMDNRDRARSDLYLAQLRSQSAPNTPGFAQTPRSPYFQTMNKIPQVSSNVADSPTQYASTTPISAKTPTQAFKLQAPPIKIHGATPKAQQGAFPTTVPVPPMSPPPQKDRHNEHVAAAPGEQTYEAVPIPGAYASPLTSPTYPPPPQHGSLAGQMQR